MGVHSSLRNDFQHHIQVMLRPGNMPEVDSGTLSINTSLSDHPISFSPFIVSEKICTYLQEYTFPCTLLE